MNEQLKLWLNQLYTFMNESEGPVGEDQLDEFLEEYPVPGDDVGDPWEKVQQVYDRMQSDPEFKALVMDKKNQAKFEKALGLASDIIVTGVEVADAKEQIRQADKAERELVKPTGPTPLKKNKKLQAALRRAELDLAGEGDAAAMSPYERAIQDQYTKDLAVAKTASTGQAGAYGAMAQAAGTRRLANARQMVPMLADRRQQSEANMQGLIGMDIAEDQARKQLQAQRYGQDLSQYNMDRNLIAETGSAGRLNKSMARRSMADSITQLLGEPLYASIPLKKRNYLNPVVNSYKNALM